jgi:sterol desaturase/sphingolipid hydroxylase (fatty acid hydroxylase superfamily)
MVAYLLWPALVATFGMIALLASRAGPIGLGLVGTAVIFVLIIVERLRPRSAAESVHDDPQLAHDLGHAILAQGGALAADALALTVGTFAAARLGLGLWPSGWPLAVQAVLAVVLADGLEYWRHRLLHRVGWLWPVHALHHHPDRLHALKGPRNTVLDMGMRSLVVYAPLAAVGVPAALLLWYPLVTVVLGPIAHSNIAFRFPAFVHRVLVTPPAHRLHHARDVELSNGNFAVVTPLWDLVFGTFHDPDGRPAPAVGIEHDRIPDDFVGQALSPLLWPRLSATQDARRALAR